MIWKTAWKNVWRNKIRSLVVIASVTIGIFGGVFAVAVMNGAIEQRVDAALNEEIGHIQINKKGFRDNMDMNLLLNGAGPITPVLDTLDQVEAYTKRLLVSGMANTASKSTGVQIIGIDPEKEKKVFRLYEETIPGTGDFFETTSRFNLAYIGESLAKDLNIIRFRIDDEDLEHFRDNDLPGEIITKLESLKGTRFKSEKDFTKQLKKLLTPKEQKSYGSRILEEAWYFSKRSKLTLTFLDKDNYQTGAIFRIAGIYDINNNMYEKSMVFIQRQDLIRLTGLREDAYHKLIIRLKSREETKKTTEIIKQDFPDLEVMNWKDIQPDLAMMTDLIQKFYAAFMVIILAALAFGIVNTMLMVVLERTKELGMLTAIGMNKKRVFSMIMLESVFLSIIGGLVGMIVSEILIAFTSTNGINFSGYSEGLEALGYSSHIYPVISADFFFIVTGLIILTGILSSIYPALKALKLDPAEALRTE